jgi:hypothetical protein
MPVIVEPGVQDQRVEPRDGSAVGEDVRAQVAGELQPHRQLVAAPALRAGAPGDPQGRGGVEIIAGDTRGKQPLHDHGLVDVLANDVDAPPCRAEQVVPLRGDGDRGHRA